MSRFGACSARISGDRQTHTERLYTITLAAHARRGLTTHITVDTTWEQVKPPNIVNNMV